MKKVLLFAFTLIIFLVLDVILFNAACTLSDKLGYNFFTDLIKFVVRYFFEVAAVVCFWAIFFKKPN